MEYKFSGQVAEQLTHWAVNPATVRSSGVQVPPCPLEKCRSSSVAERHLGKMEAMGPIPIFGSEIS